MTWRNASGHPAHQVAGQDFTQRNGGETFKQEGHIEQDGRNFKSYKTTWSDEQDASREDIVKLNEHTDYECTQRRRHSDYTLLEI